MNVIKIEGQALSALLAGLEPDDKPAWPVYRLRVALDDGYVKFKVNEYGWSPPFEVEQEAAQ